MEMKHRKTCKGCIYYDDSMTSIIAWHRAVDRHAKYFFYCHKLKDWKYEIKSGCEKWR